MSAYTYFLYVCVFWVFFRFVYGVDFTYWKWGGAFEVGKIFFLYRTLVTIFYWGFMIFF